MQKPKGMRLFWFGTAQNGRLEGAFCRGMRLFGKRAAVVREMYSLLFPELRLLPDKCFGKGMEVRMMGETSGQYSKTSSIALHFLCKLDCGRFTA
jgi:hypothetical protein